MRKPVRNPLVGITVGVVGLVGVGLGQSLPNRHQMERDLTRRAESALVAGGVDGARGRFTGRDGEIVVASGGDVDKARPIVGAQDGVRVVAVTAPKAPPTPTTTPKAVVDPTVTATVDGGKIALTGTVRDRTALVTALGGAVDDHLVVDANAGDKG